MSDMWKEGGQEAPGGAQPVGGGDGTQPAVAPPVDFGRRATDKLPGGTAQHTALTVGAATGSAAAVAASRLANLNVDKWAFFKNITPLTLFLIVFYVQFMDNKDVARENLRRMDEERATHRQDVAEQNREHRDELRQRRADEDERNKSVLAEIRTMTAAINASTAEVRASRQVMEALAREIKAKFPEPAADREEQSRSGLPEAPMPRARFYQD